MGALPVHHTATTDAPWDGPAAVAAMPAKEAVLSYCHAWFDSADGRDMDDGSNGDKDADGNQKKWYKFPHHKTKGGPANLAACRNGLARLDNASIPESDKAGVKKHLQAHLDDAEKKDQAQAPFVPLDDRLRTTLPQPTARTDAWYSITNATSDEPEVYLYDEIGGWFGSTADQFVAELNAITAPRLKLRLNSPGGSVFDGVAIANALRAHPADVTVQVDGIAASIASVIAMAGDRVVMMPNSTLMIHDASGVCMGNAADMQQTAELLDVLSNNIADAYAARAGGTREDWRAAMQKESWYLPDDAVAAGLADEAAGDEPAEPAEPEEPAAPPSAPAPAPVPVGGLLPTGVVAPIGEGGPPALVLPPAAVAPQAPAPAAEPDTSWAAEVAHLLVDPADEWAAEIAHLINPDSSSSAATEA